MVDFVTGLRCRECAREFPAEALHVCDYCFGPLEVAYDYDAITASVSRGKIAAGPLTLWRYADLRPHVLRSLQLVTAERAGRRVVAT